MCEHAQSAGGRSVSRTRRGAWLGRSGTGSRGAGYAGPHDENMNLSTNAAAQRGLGDVSELIRIPLSVNGAGSSACDPRNRSATKSAPPHVPHLDRPDRAASGCWLAGRASSSPCKVARSPTTCLNMQRRMLTCPLREATRTWFAISLQTFGGPAGQIAVIQRTRVDEKRWIGQGGFLHALDYACCCPGRRPSSWPPTSGGC